MKKPKSKEIFVVLVVAVIVFSALIYFVNFQKNRNSNSGTTITTTPIEAQKTSADIIPKQADVLQWSLADMQSITLNSQGFIEGSKARFSRKDGVAAIVSRVEVYNFEKNENAGEFYNNEVESEKLSGYTESNISYDIECYANSLYQNEISRYNLHCHKGNVYFHIGIVGDKVQDSSKYVSEFFDVIKSKL